MAADDVMTSPEVALQMGRSARTVHRAVRDNKLTPLAKLPGPNGAYVFRRDEVERFIAGLAEPEKQPA